MCHSQSFAKQKVSALRSNDSFMLSKLYSRHFRDFTAAPSSLKFAGSPKATARSIQHAPSSSSATRSSKEHSGSDVGAQADFRGTSHQ
jgi:hypothetical protein